MNIEEAIHIILKPYVTEKTFSLVENEKRICFLVKEESSKPKIMEAIKILYNETPVGVNVCRTVYGKKACEIRNCGEGKRSCYKDRNAIIWSLLNFLK